MTNPNRPPGLMARRTGKTYEQWLRRILRFQGMRYPHQELLERDMDLEGMVRARKSQRLPVVLIEEEVRLVLQRLEGSETLVAGLLYGSGLRLMEALRLRVHDLDFNRQELNVRNGKGGKDIRTMLPKRVSKKLRIHFEKARTVHQRD